MSQVIHIGLNHFLVLAAMLFVIGLYGILTKKNGLSRIIGIVFMIASVNIMLIAFSRFEVIEPSGQIFAIVIMIASVFQIAIIAAAVLMKNRAQYELIENK